MEISTMIASQEGLIAETQANRLQQQGTAAVLDKSCHHAFSPADDSLTDNGMQSPC